MQRGVTPVADQFHDLRGPIRDGFRRCSAWSNRGDPRCDFRSHARRLSPSERPQDAALRADREQKCRLHAIAFQHLEEALRLRWEWPVIKGEVDRCRGARGAGAGATVCAVVDEAAASGGTAARADCVPTVHPSAEAHATTAIVDKRR